MADRKLVVVGVSAALGGFLLGALVFGGGSNSPPNSSSPSDSDQSSRAEIVETLESAQPEAEEQPEQEAPAPETPASDWLVAESTEAMTDETIKTACVTSSNQIHLDFPYGSRRARLCIRQHPRFGQDAYLTLDGSGQILCNSYDGCTIRIRFDDGAVQSFSANGPSDNSTETVFVANTSRFIAAARNVQRIRVQLEFYQNGLQTFDFPARGLEW